MSVARKHLAITQRAVWGCLLPLPCEPWSVLLSLLAAAQFITKKEFHLKNQSDNHFVMSGNTVKCLLDDQNAPFFFSFDEVRETMLLRSTSTTNTTTTIRTYLVITVTSTTWRARSSTADARGALVRFPPLRGCITIWQHPELACAACKCPESSISDKTLLT